MGAQWPVGLILIAAMFGLLQCFNGNFVAASRLLFSFGRRGTIPVCFAAIHPSFQTPSIAIAGVALATLAAGLCSRRLAARSGDGGRLDGLRHRVALRSEAFHSSWSSLVQAHGSSRQSEQSWRYYSWR